jgi:hypothetical protein
MATKNQLLALAKKNNVNVRFDFGSDYVIEMDAYNRKFNFHCADGHGVSACGEDAADAYSDAIMMIKYGFTDCEGCEDSYCRTT